MKVDGQKVETRKAFGAFLAIDVGSGDHVIDFSYFPEGLKPGVLITGGSIVILIFLWFLRREMERRERSSTDAQNPENAAGIRRRTCG
ncbi:MAG: YfhO family protein [Roseburia sp.]